MTSTSKLISALDAAALIPDGAAVTVSSSSGLGCPDAVLRALGDRFRTSGEPRGLTTIHPIAAGDMYGIDGIDHIAEDGLLTRVIAGSYPSGPSSLPSPKIWQMIHEDRVEAYNVPSGILFQWHAEIATGRPGVLTSVGMGTYLDPRQTGGKMNAATQADLIELVEFDGREWLYLRSIPLDVAIIRGTTADTRGNISMEHEGAYLGALEQAIAVRNCGGIVIAQVKRVVTEGTIPAQQVRIPGIFVDYLVLDPEQAQTTQTAYDPAISGEVRVPSSTFEPAPWGAEKVIARRAAMELRRGEAVNLGFGVSALVPRILIEEGLHGSVSWVIEQGAVGGVPLLEFQFGCAVNADGIVPSPQQFMYFQGGGFDRTLLSFLQVGADGSVNVSKLASRPHVTAGVGGFVDITANARNIVFSGFMTAGGLEVSIDDGRLTILKEGRSKKFVPDLEHITFSGQNAKTRNQRVVFVTERCVIRLENGALMVTEVAPGIDLERDVLAQADVPLHVSPDLRTMEPRLFRPEPVGMVLEEKRDV
jgi:acyl CoA:acetate/3-ketoacid CoA transferase